MPEETLQKFETLELTNETYDNLPGQKKQLSLGPVYYQLEGSQDGHLVVLVHGMSIPSFIWQPTARALVDAGYQVLCFDLYGRGYSARPRVRHDLDLYVEQTAELIKALCMHQEPCSLVGFSLGAAVCAAYAQQQPELVKKVVLIDPTHPDDMPTSPANHYKFMMRFGLLARQTDDRILSGLENNFHEYEKFPEFENLFARQMQYKGFAEAIMSTLIDFRFWDLPEVYEALSEQKTPTCLIWGEEDKQADFETNEEMRKLLPNARFHAIPEAGHVSHYERPDLVNPILVEFLGE